MESQQQQTNVKKVIVYLGLACLVVLVILVIMETYSYYFAAAGSAKTTDLAMATDRHLPGTREGFDVLCTKCARQRIGTQEGFDVLCTKSARQRIGTQEGFDVIDTKDEVKQFPDIIDYIEKVEEPQFYNKSRVIGCYDNNDIIGRARPGETCKSWYKNVTDIFFKPQNPAQVPVDSENANYNNYFNVEGQAYSFAELCPETTGQKDPIACLYDRAQGYNLMSTKIANINDSIQNNLDRKISNMSDDVSYHVIDGNRIYNQPHVLDFIGYECSLGLGSAIHGGTPGDQLDDLELYTKKQRVNYLAGVKNAGASAGTSTGKKLNSAS